MDGSAAPWRVLDESTGSGTAPAPAGHAPSPPQPTALPWRTLAGLAIAGALAAGAFAMAAAGPGGTVVVDGGQALASGPGASTGALASGLAGEVVVVDVQGAILRPGVHRLARGSRVGDAIAAAGGYGPRVDAERAARELNLAAVLADGDRILVPSRDDVVAVGPGASGGAAVEAPGDGLVDLNSASESELDELPGVGPVTAQKIIDARAEQPFTSVDDLLTREVLGQSAFDKLRELVTVR
jgi:competence protein ComEA